MSCCCRAHVADDGAVASASRHFGERSTRIEPVCGSPVIIVCAACPKYVLRVTGPGYSSRKKFIPHSLKSKASFMKLSRVTSLETTILGLTVANDTIALTRTTQQSSFMLRYQSCLRIAACSVSIVSTCAWSFRTSKCTFREAHVFMFAYLRRAHRPPHTLVVRISLA